MAEYKELPDKYVIEGARVSDFFRWRETNSSQRLGQAFYDYMDLSRMRYDPRIDRLWGLDGIEALRAITSLFDFN